MMETRLQVMTMKKNFLQHKDTKDWSKSMGRKVDFAVVFTDITRRRALPEEAFIHTAQMTAIKVA